MSLSPIERDRRAFFEIAFNADTTLAQLVAAYVGFTGIIYDDQVSHFVSQLDSRLGTQAIGLRAQDLIRADKTLNLDPLINYLDPTAEQYLGAWSPSDIETIEILPASANEWHDTSLPHPLNQRLHRQHRLAFSARILTGGHIFVGPYQLCYLDEHCTSYAPDFSLRRYGTHVARRRKIEVEQVLIVVQDEGNGSNFSHFLFDWVSRILHCLDKQIVDKQRMKILLGGERTAFHDLVVEHVCSLHGLSAGQFLFPDEEVILHCKDRVVFFSDAKNLPLHPAQMAHPRSIRLLGDLASSISTPASPARHVYVSREDATLRKIANESELIAIARELDFEVICMGEHPITEQIAIVRSATTLAGPHGMGLTHILFNGGPLSVVELFHPSLGTDAYCFISKALGFHYDFLIGQSVDDGKASYTIDPLRFREALIAAKHRAVAAAI